MQPVSHTYRGGGISKLLISFLKNYNGSKTLLPNVGLLISKNVTTVNLNLTEISKFPA